MASNYKALLRSFQHADSFFPSGTVAISSGLESLNADGVVDTSLLGDFELCANSIGCRDEDRIDIVAGDKLTGEIELK